MQVYLEMGRLFLVFKEMRAYGVRKVYEFQWDEEKMASVMRKKRFKETLMNKVVQIAADDFLKIVCRWFLQAGVCENHFLFSDVFQNGMI